MFATSPADDWAFGVPVDADECRVHGPDPSIGRALSEFAGILFDLHTRSEGIAVSATPRASRSGDAPAYVFDYTVPARDLSGTV